ncbi:hypothetical protein EW145_g7512 [Phellinidium pouzarii]|uniref:Glucose-methanol-choline oxidoreductase N-terminal domain-containing protein n=1 Tax=Phellinidium pouzarii TaxID=167371 RepID=A0A4S4KID2_9AGAM|nr:hypothetical protein EW145_g7512 [Phellinidium pouzarii]
MSIQLAGLRSHKDVLTSASVILLSYAVVRFLVKSKASTMWKNDIPRLRMPEEVGRLVDGSNNGEALPECDIVIVGGGTAGCALAARISEDPNIRVLVLEAGGSGKTHLELRMPPAYPRLFHNNEIEYDLYTTEQVHAAGTKRYWPRGKVLGGCSSMNASIFHAGAPSDYDEWAQRGLEGSEGWAFSEFQKYFLKFEKFVPHTLFPNVDSSLRGTSGAVEVGYFGFFSNLSSKWIEACKFIGIPYVPDINTIAGTMGVTKLMTYLNSMGMRVSSETAYLTPDVMKRPNLTIATYAKVTKLLFDTTGGKKRAVGVEFARGKGSKRYRVKARKEVILS